MQRNARQLRKLSKIRYILYRCRLEIQSRAEKEAWPQWQEIRLFNDGIDDSDQEKKNVIQRYGRTAKAHVISYLETRKKA